MCTLSWIVREDGYDLFFSRDERRTRLPAEAPFEDRRAGVRFVGPRDGDFGGSWIVANERGVTTCMLNLYVAGAASGPDDAFVSRGLLVLELADAATAREPGERIARREMRRYRPFSAVTFAPGHRPRLVQWDGARLAAVSLTDLQRPFVSSGYDVEGARRTRRAAFAALREAGEPGPDDLDAFHRSHAPARGPYSPCMHRDDAATVSLVRVAVDDAIVRMWYAAGPPCENPFGAPLELSRAPMPPAGG